jgi:hypothetical protein
MAKAMFGNPMPHYLNTLTIAENQVIADPGATSIFIMEGADMANKRVTTSPLTINFPNGKKIRSIHVHDIHIPGLPTVLVGHIVLSLTIASLIGIWPLCKAGCTVAFDNEKCNVIFNGEVILTELKDPSRDLWTLPIPHSRMWTTPSLVTIGPYSARMMQSHQLGYANLTSLVMVPGRLSTCVMQGNLEMAPTLPRPSPCIGRAPHPLTESSDIHPGIDIATFTHSVQMQANTV